MAWGFEVGRTYNRRRDIHARLGGQQQGGIITPSRTPIVILITGAEGAAHGYSDRQRADGVFEYFGEGQSGDMEFVRGNAAILNHAREGKDLLLFSKQREGLRFEGVYVCEGFHRESAPDTQGNVRSAIVFELRPLEAVIEVEAGDDLAGDGRQVDIVELRKRALAAASLEPERRERSADVFERSRAVRNYVLARANGCCEYCGASAPFRTPSGQPFIEVHHIRRLTDGGPDDPCFMIGLCPNCHRGAHFGMDAEAWNKSMLEYVTSVERQN
jgi:5-methylcytosine-specific restriction protein A